MIRCQSQAEVILVEESGASDLGAEHRLELDGWR